MSDEIGFKSAWQPIETAPKDREIIVYSGFDEVCTAYYDGETDSWFRSGKHPCDFDFVSGDEVYPTHWMPLPAPPVEAKSEVVESSQPRWEVGKNGWDASDEATREDI